MIKLIDKPIGIFLCPKGSITLNGIIGYKGQYQLEGMVIMQGEEYALLSFNGIMILYDLTYRIISPFSMAFKMIFHQEGPLAYIDSVATALTDKDGDQWFKEMKALGYSFTQDDAKVSLLKRFSGGVILTSDGNRIPFYSLFNFVPNLYEANVEVVTTRMIENSIFRRIPIPGYCYSMDDINKAKDELAFIARVDVMTNHHTDSNDSDVVQNLRVEGLNSVKATLHRDRERVHSRDEYQR